MRFSTFVTGALTAALVAAHPGEQEHVKEKERLARRTFLQNVERRDLSHCASKLKARGVEARNIQRRADKASALRRELGIPELHRTFAPLTCHDPLAIPMTVVESVCCTKSANMGSDSHPGRQSSDLNVNVTLNTSHHSDANYTINTPHDVIFASNASCVLSPEVVLGPYYVAGEYIVSNVTQDQVGVPLHLEVQVVNVETCEPIDNVYAEIWGTS